MNTRNTTPALDALALGPLAMANLILLLRGRAPFSRKPLNIALGTTAVCLLAWGWAPVAAMAGQRPLTDFTSRQAAWCAVFDDVGFLDCAASGYGGTACEIGFSFTAPQFWSDPKSGITAGVDVLGQLDPGSFGTTVEGSVSESPLPDGRSEVKVVVHTRNALFRAFKIDPSTFETQLLFGHTFGEVEEGAAPTLGDLLFQVKFKNTRIGAPLPDLAQLMFCPEPGQELDVISIRAHASGPLRAAFGVPEGTPGRLEVTQIGLIAIAAKANPNSRVALDAFPAEHVIIRAVGK